MPEIPADVDEIGHGEVWNGGDEEPETEPGVVFEGGLEGEGGDEDALVENEASSRFLDRIRKMNEKVMKDVLDFFQRGTEMEDEYDDLPRENRRR